MILMNRHEQFAQKLAAQIEVDKEKDEILATTLWRPGRQGGGFISVERHPTDFTILGTPGRSLEPSLHDVSDEVVALPGGSVRVTVEPSKQPLPESDNDSPRDKRMDQVRSTRVAHHVYQGSSLYEDGPVEEFLLTDRILLRFRRFDVGMLKRVIEQFSLEFVRDIEKTHVLRVTDRSRRNPLKIANRLAELDGEVELCVPEILVPFEPRSTAAPVDPKVFDLGRWHIDSSSRVGSSGGDPRPEADIDVLEAWEITRGDPDVRVAIIDDGFDLGHPEFDDLDIDPQAIDLLDSDSDPRPEAADDHGTPVASIALGRNGIAPGCTFVPIRVDLGGPNRERSVSILEAFEYASQNADVLICSFGLKPSSVPLLDPGIRNTIAEIARAGGRRGQGLVIAVSAGNSNLPVAMSAADNHYGFRVREGKYCVSIPAKKPVFTGFGSIEGLVTVGAVTSALRRPAYANWGDEISVVAPSSNADPMGGVTNRPEAYKQTFYPGVGIVAAINRPGIGRAPARMRNNPRTPLREDYYRGNFGGTSAAAPIVGGVAALMLSVNPDLLAIDVKRILESTADRTGFNFAPYNLRDSNLRVPDRDHPDAPKEGDPPPSKFRSGEFNSEGVSEFFGHGKVNAYRAVLRARALRTARGARSGR